MLCIRAVTFGSRRGSDSIHTGGMGGPNVESTTLIEKSRPVRAWRVWGVSDKGFLTSISAPADARPTLWAANQHMIAEDLPYEECGPSQPGFHAYQNRDDAMRGITRPNLVVGQVDLWGTVDRYTDPEGRACFKATNACPASLTAAFEPRVSLDSLANRYGIPLTRP